MSVGFVGIQFGFALQNGNASRILQGYGAPVEMLPNFWLIAPIIGLLAQPLIGHYSDQTWTRLGRRRPYFLAAATCAAIALCLMPNAAFFAPAIPALWVGAVALMLMDASFNISMEPSRAMVADMLPPSQRNVGFSVQTVLIGIGAVVGSWLPYMFANWFGVENTAELGRAAPNVVWSFYAGALVLVLTISWAVFSTKEYSPKEMAEFAGRDRKQANEKTGPRHLLTTIWQMPKTMKQLGMVQFCTWFGLFSMWVFTMPAVATHIYGCAVDDSSSQAYQDAGDWVGVIFGVYNLVSLFFALAMPTIADRLGRKTTHSLALTCGAVGLVSIYFISNPFMLLFSMVGVGIAWASILAMPYAILAGAIPVRKMGVYMGIFNFFIIIPQFASGLLNRPLVKYIFGSQSIYVLVMAGCLFFIAAVAVLFVYEEKQPGR